MDEEVEKMPEEQQEQLQDGAEDAYSQDDDEQKMIKVLMQWDIEDIAERDIVPEDDFFALGMLQVHGLIDDDLHITPQGIKEFERLVDEMVAERAKNVQDDPDQE